MRFGEYVKLSWTNIMSHKLRSLLSLLGVTFGIASVIAIMTMMSGLQGSLVDVITQDLLRADTISITLEGSFGFFGGDRVFSERDVERLKSLDGVRDADVGGQVRGAALYLGGKRLLDADVLTTTSPDIVPLGVGRLTQGPGEIVLGASVAEKVLKELGVLPDLEDDEYQRQKLTGQLVVDFSQVLGQEMRFRYLDRERKAQEAALTVVGVVKESQFLSGGSCYVDIGYHSDSETIDGQDYLVFPGVLVRVADLDHILEVRDEVEAYLTSEESDVYKLVGDEPKLNVQTTKELVDEIQANFVGIAAFLGGIGGVALFVGMIGVMNIMLVSVKERTREIGIMKATGATNGFVMRAFLTECTLICLLGSVLGIGLGMLGSLGISQALIAISMGLEEIPFVFTLDWYLYAVVTGVVVGVASGMYPAWSAAKTDPIQALRYE